MDRRIFLATGLVCLLAGGTAFASDFADIIITELKQQGYTRIETENTWLGRVRIVAERQNGTREIILNPRTGEILRDLWLLADGTASRSGEAGIFDRGYDDDKDDDKDDDNSGSGSSGSGSGGSDDSDSSDDSSGSDDSSDDD